MSSTFSYTKTFLNGPLRTTKIGRGTSADFNNDGYLDVVFSTDISTAALSTLSPVDIFMYNPKTATFDLTKVTIDNVPNSLPMLYFGRDVVSADINRDGIADIIPIDQTEIRAPAGSGITFYGADQYAYISSGIGNYNKVSLAPGLYSVHGFGTIDSADGKFRFLLHTPWGDNTMNGVASIISTFNDVTKQFDSELFTRSSSFYSQAPQNGYPNYFFESTIDINHDGNTDIIGFSTDGGISNLYLNNGHGEFNFSKSINTGLAKGIVVEEVTNGDFNGDGYIDIALFAVNRQVRPGNEYKTIRVLVNDQHGNFTDQTSQWLHGEYQNIPLRFAYLETRDINLDGRDDIIMSGDIGIVFASAGNTFDIFKVESSQQTMLVLDNNHYISNGYNSPGSMFTLSVDNHLPTAKPAKPLATIDGKWSDYTITHNDHAYTLKSNHSSDYLLINDTVNRINFADAVVALDVSITGNAGQAYMLYQAAFDRKPDVGGLSYWINALDHKASTQAIAESFISSPEFQTRYGANSSVNTFVNGLYQNVLHRAPDADGYAFWSKQLSTQDTASARASILQGFAYSPENQANVVDLIGQGIQYEPVV